MSWPLVKLNQVAEINPKLPKDIDDGQQVTFLPMSAVSETGKIIGGENRVLAETKKGFTYFEYRDVLLAKITPCFENGKAVLVDELKTQIGFGSTEFHVIRVVPEKLDPKYLFYLIWNDYFRHVGYKYMTGSAGQKRVPAQFLKDFKIPLPPLETQKHIATILEKADQLGKDCVQMEQELNNLAQSVFIDMFGDPVSNPKGWEVQLLGEIASVQLGKMLSNKAKQGINPKKYLRNANIQWRKVEFHDLLEMDFNHKEMKKFELKVNDLLVCEGGEIGRCAIWRGQLDDCYYQKALHRIRLNDKIVTPEYLQEYFYWMAKRGGLSNSVNEVTFKHLTAEKINKLPVPLPPLDFQNMYSVIYLSLEQKIIENNTLSRELNTIFSALMQKAFKGELKIKNKAA